MLTETTKQEIRDKLAAVAKSMPGFRSRPAQRLMIAEVAKTLARCDQSGAAGSPSTPGSAILCVQGGTGTGKSLGYSIPVLVLAREKGKKVVVSSSTVALQEQLSFRDLPLFTDASGMKVRIEIAKGRTRYVCLYKLRRASMDMQQLEMFQQDEPATDAADNEAIRKDIEAMISEYTAQQWDGDRDTRPVVSDVVWRSLTTDRHGCLNRTCPYFHECAQMKARKRLKEADVVVTNHDLLLADLTLGGGKILPKPEDTFYVIDEAHSLPEKAVDAFASHHMVSAERRAVEKLATLSSSLRSVLGAAFSPLADAIERDAERLSEHLGEVLSYFNSLSQLVPTREAPRPSLEFAESCIPEEFHLIGDNIRNLADSLMSTIDSCSSEVQKVAASDSAQKALCEKLMADLGFHCGRLLQVESTWRLFLAEPKSESAPPVAKWVETVTFKRQIDFQLNASPVTSASYLRAHLWEKAAGCILASATLTTLGSFDDYLRRSGLLDLKVATVELPSPFDYATQGVIDIPNVPSPKNYSAHTEAVRCRIVADMEQQGAEGMLVLFTSRRQMEDVVAEIQPELRKRILVQGEQSKNALLTTHRARIDAGQPSVVFGLASMTEGVDLPGKYCSQVVVTKLPFAVPDSPVLRALSDWITRRGGDPFMEISVPDAGRKLEQMCGRLIRTETDSGRVVITDPRLWDSRFGRRILKGLPPFRIFAKGKEVGF